MDGVYHHQHIVIAVKKYDICMTNIEHNGNVVNGLLIEINESSIWFEEHQPKLDDKMISDLCFDPYLHQPIVIIIQVAWVCFVNFNNG
jgi:predicted nicotinamide N-methyase